MRELLWMQRGREEAEWFRLSHFMAFIANKFRFSRDDPHTHPKDLNPFMRAPKSHRVQASAKEQMAGLWARNSNIPLKMWTRTPEGSWVSAR